MKKLIFALQVLLLMAPAACKPENQKQESEATLRELADSAGMLIGVRAFLKDDAQKALVEKEFNTSTRTCYPVSINPGPGKHDFESFNEGVNWLYERGMKPMHHMLCGPTQYESGWVKGITSAEVLDSLLEERIRSIMLSNDNASKVNVWNVVNESLNWNGGEFQGQYFMKDKVTWTRLGWEEDKSGLTGDDKINDRHPVYIRKAFEYAAKYAKGKLELRDNGCEKPGRKARALYQLVRHLQESGVKIDAVGLQCHYPIEGEGALNPQGLAYEISRYRKLGLEVYLTEVDFGRKDIPWTEETAQKQKEEYKKIMTVALNEGVSQVHFWGLRDADENWRRDENPLLFDENLNPKPAYYGVKEALEEYLERKK
ncbi:MAG TPA: endo-1,4-beta-xylanase [Bacteroidales bacterium]|nr:endo-1,4-beta-xylanase [Bacteroidales bacterium]